MPDRRADELGWLRALIAELPEFLDEAGVAPGVLRRQRPVGTAAAAQLEADR